MCLDPGCFHLVHGNEERDLQHITSILPGKTGLRLIDAFGKIEEVAGAIEEIDLLNRRIVIAA
ncbi:CooT family nickel-binding protein [Geoalkalibacter halelectricus]|uniref:CooT family nickel-binding protein n=1 Tax=Geoalkalibacter halelectricus TaxID=2847045 RepID=A0ABY5ZLB6_9BACT|nr:CooT family nickel-binding protein [Geoalkalibacter halelectricus]MDO3378791.1 CooT family nickel-binding protein [Geoalkalibacter halelectricus]UWZ79903.1 CooT family nickel-binding protein [Geoalkalibacter halelectricus]